MSPLCLLFSELPQSTLPEHFKDNLLLILGESEKQTALNPNRFRAAPDLLLGRDVTPNQPQLYAKRAP